MLNRLFLILVMATVASPSLAQTAVASTVDLSGTWRFALDRDDAGLNNRWFADQLSGTDVIKIPGVLQAQGFGDDISVDTPWVAALPRDMHWYSLPQYAPYTKAGDVKMPYLAQPPKHYLGVAWYQRDIDILQSDSGKCEHLFLERPHWGSNVWLDDQQVGTCNSLVAPHEFDLGIVALGKHRLTVRLDNRMSVVPGYPSQLPELNTADVLTTTDWNAAKARLAERGKAIFTPLPNMLDDSCPPMASRPIFWNRVMNNTNPKGLSPVGFLGLLVDSKHPALSEFPSEDYCDWQWTDIINGVRAINLESVASQLTPIVQAIDDWNRGFKLGVVFECNVGKGKLPAQSICKASQKARWCDNCVNRS
jgi:hypothetical protein